MPFHLLPVQNTDRMSSRRASESHAALSAYPSNNNGRSGIKEMLQSSLSTTSNQTQDPAAAPSIMITDSGGRPRSSSLTLLKKKLSTSASRNSVGNLGLAEPMSRGRSMSNELHSTTSNISMAPTDVASIISSSYDHQDPQRYEKPNKYLVNYLKTQGLSEPSKLAPLLKKHHKIFGSRKSIPSDLELFLSNSGNMLLLPYVPSKKFTRTADEEADDAGDDDEGGNEEEDLDEEYDSTTTDSNGHGRSTVVPPPVTAIASDSTMTPLNRINHTFAVILKLDRKQTLNTIIKAKFASNCSVDWVNGIPDAKDPSKIVFNESYKVSKDLVWDLNLDHTDCFIPFEEKNDEEEDAIDDLKFMDDSESSATNDSKPDNIVISATPSQELKKLEVFNHKDRAKVDQSALDLDYGYHYHHESAVTAKQYDAGYYVFLMPVLFPPTTAESIVSPLGKVTYELSIKLQPFIAADLKPPQQAAFATSPVAMNRFSSPLQPVSSGTSPNTNGLTPLTSNTNKNTKGFLKGLKHVGGDNSNKKKEESVKEFQFELPIIRQPPPGSITTINKSVYVNKIWNEALNYEITFPKKYVPMSSLDDDIVNSFDLKIKIMPLVKKIYMKRIRVNMIEKITYASKDLKYEYDFGKEFAVDKGIKERIIPLFEIKTKEKSHGSQALRSETVRNCIDDNLLTTCYDDYKPSKRSKAPANDDEDVVVINTVKVSCPLTFHIKNDEVVKNIRSSISGSLNGYDEDDTESVTSVDSNPKQHISPTSSLINMLSKSPMGSNSSILPQGNGRKDDHLSPHALLKEKYGLYPDVAGFGNIVIKHRLQVCFRISKLENPALLKPGDDPNKLHHYEVIIDTPIILNSPFANDHEPPAYTEVDFDNTDNFQIRPVYNTDDGLDPLDLDELPPPPPFEFHIGSPINGYDIQSEFNSNSNDLTDTISPFSTSVEFSQHHNNNNNNNNVDYRDSSPMRQRQQSIAASSRHPSISAGPGQGFSNIDELLVVENNQSNLSKLLSTGQTNNSNNKHANGAEQFDHLPAPPEYSQLDHFKSDEEEIDIGGENFIEEDELGNHDEYNKKRIAIAKRQNHALMKKVEDDLGDFSF